MNFNEYQELAKRTAQYSSIGEMFVYPTLGLASEAGELAGKVKKIFRDKKGAVDDETRKDITKELGDVLWYVSQVASEFNLSLNKVAEENIKKLGSRLERGTLHGDGDDR